MFQHPNATMGHAPGRHAQMGAMVPLRRFDIVGADAPTETTWDKLKKWGDEETFSVKNKYLAAGALVASAVVIYGAYEGWFD